MSYQKGLKIKTNSNNNEVHNNNNFTNYYNSNNIVEENNDLNKQSFLREVILIGDEEKSVTFSKSVKHINEHFDGLNINRNDFEIFCQLDVHLFESTNSREVIENFRSQVSTKDSSLEYTESVIYFMIFIIVYKNFMNRIIKCL